VHGKKEPLVTLVSSGVSRPRFGPEPGRLAAAPSPAWPGLWFACCAAGVWSSTAAEHLFDFASCRSKHALCCVSALIVFFSHCLLPPGVAPVGEDRNLTSVVRSSAPGRAKDVSEHNSCVAEHCRVPARHFGLFRASLKVSPCCRELLEQVPQ